MPVTIAPNAAPVYPALMISELGTIKLFINATDGVILSKPGATSLADNVSHLAMDGKTKEAGRPAPATASFWSRFNGTITLGND